MNYIHSKDYLQEPIVTKFKFLEWLNEDLEYADDEADKNFPKLACLHDLPTRKHRPRLTSSAFSPAADDTLAINHPRSPLVLVSGTEYSNGLKK